MFHRALAFALALTSAGVGPSSGTAGAQSRLDQSAWLRTESQHFEVHYLSALAPELDRVVRSAERAYEQISGRLNFVLAARVPLVMFAPSGSMTREQVAAYAISDQVAPPQPHRSRIVLPIPQGMRRSTR